MTPVSTKLTLLVLVLPLTLLAFALFAAAYISRTPFAISGVLDFLSTIVSVVLVDILVWERLRDSLFKKLEYLHQNALSTLHQQLRNDVLESSYSSIERTRIDLARHGTFVGISLYPKGMLSEMDAFLTLSQKFSSRYKSLEERTRELVGKSNVNRNLLLELLELKPGQLSSYSHDAVWRYKEACGTLLQEQSNTIEQMKHSLRKMRDSRQGMFGALEAFLKANSLSLG
jgi:hypothetical protein